MIVSMVAAQVCEEPPPSREHARERFPVKALGMQLRDEATNLRWLQFPQRQRSCRAEQRANVTLIIPHRMSAESTLMFEVFKIAPEQGLASGQARFRLPQLAPTYRSNWLFNLFYTVRNESWNRSVASG